MFDFLFILDTMTWTLDNDQMFQTVPSQLKQKQKSSCRAKNNRII